MDVVSGERGARVMISRTHPGLVKRLFELEVPEIYDGTVEVKGQLEAVQVGLIPHIADLFDLARPVSYTHLDVYKRQEITSTRSPTA